MPFTSKESVVSIGVVSGIEIAGIRFL